MEPRENRTLDDIGEGKKDERWRAKGRRGRGEEKLRSVKRVRYKKKIREREE